jgi:ABC-type Zn uptake system ZnuABC Zn-binding protein ZnuA
MTTATTFPLRSLALAGRTGLAGLVLLMAPLGLAGAAPESASADPSADSLTGSAPVRVVATLSVYADLARTIGGNEVSVTAIAHPNEDAHFVRPKPSFALELRRADLFVTTGLDLELWVPPLLDRAGNRRVMEGGEGYVTAYTGITLLDIPVAADRSQGDVHLYGNPHLHTDPLRALQMARNITRGLTGVAPDRTAIWQRGLQRFQNELYRRTFGDRLVEVLGGETLEQLALNGTLLSFLEDQEFEGHALIQDLGGWLGAMRGLRGRQMICYHKTWAYLEERFGLSCAEYVESRPGIAPTPRHVARLIELMRERGIGVLLAESHFDRHKVEAVAERGGAVAVIVPLYPGAQARVPDYFTLVDVWVEALTGAFAATL